MKHLPTFLLFAASAFAQTATITDTIATPFAGTFSGTVTVTLNSPALAQPLYSGNVTLSGWTQTVTVTAGAFALTLYTNDLITPGGTSYTATYAPTSGSGWKETWVVPTGATTIRAIRSTTVPTPSVKFNLSQLNQNSATLGQGIRWNGTAWEAAANVQATVLIFASGTEATCNSSTRGYVVMVQGGVGVADTFRICRKDAADAYAWTALF
jgi:hypothetical protein